MWPNQIRSYYLTANANSANPYPNSKFDQVWQEKGSTVAVQRWHFKCTTSTFKQIKTTRYNLQKRVDSLHFAWNRFRCQPTTWGPVNFGARVQSSQNCPIVRPTGVRPGCLWPPGGAFTNTAAAENLNCKGGKNRVAWMADILGWHNDQVGRKIPRRELRCNCIIGTGSHHFSNRAAKLTQGQVFEKLKKRKIGIKFLKLSLSSYLFCWKTWFPRMQDIF